MGENKVVSTPKRTISGTPGILMPLKKWLKLLPSETAEQGSDSQADQAHRPEVSVLGAEHAMLRAFFKEIHDQDRVNRRTCHLDDHLKNSKVAQQMLAESDRARAKLLLAAAEYRFAAISGDIPEYHMPSYSGSGFDVGYVINMLCNSKPAFSRSELMDWMLYVTVDAPGSRQASIMPALNSLDLKQPLSEGERYALHLYRTMLIKEPLLGSDSPSEHVQTLTRLIGDDCRFFLIPGEYWADALNNDLGCLLPNLREKWSQLLTHVSKAKGARPSARWLKVAQELLADVGQNEVADALLRWLPLVGKRRNAPVQVNVGMSLRHVHHFMNEANTLCLRNLLWCAPLLGRNEVFAHEIAAVAMNAYRVSPVTGNREVKLGNGAIYALSALADTAALGQLAKLKLRVKFGSAQKEIEKAYIVTAEKMGMSRDDIEELVVPSYGLEQGGVRTEKLGDYQATIDVVNSDVTLSWSDATGKQLKSVPAKVRKEHKDELKELKQAHKDIQAMVPAQKERIDGLFLSEKTWPFSQWLERYFQHPLVGTITRRLIWCIDGCPVVFVNDEPHDVNGKHVTHGKTAEVTLWHPVGRSVAEIIAWRERLETLGIKQPFKQAHREVYLLTDAERNTGRYSNRYAAHVIRQHQFNALCSARGWKNQLRLMVDQDYPPAVKLLPQWGLRAEFWVEGIGDTYGVDTNEIGTFLRLATDQVRFYRMETTPGRAWSGSGDYNTVPIEAQEEQNRPISLEEIPPLVLSEIMRDVDLFVGVASVGNDPTWQDGGPDGEHRDYWHGYSFGELSATAATRKQVLEKLLPRLKIAGQCTLQDRFLVVKGTLRTYKIHLGSGNILMAPNDQYLCIVPDAHARMNNPSVHLPFEGDGVFSIILSKAFMLAEDTKIKDPTIIEQIKLR